MPVKGAGVRRTGKFADIERVITSHGFQRGAPNHPPCPGFYFYSRDGFVVQILHGRRVSITRPDRSVQIVSAQRLITLDTAMDILQMEIEEQQMQEEENL